MLFYRIVAPTKANDFVKYERNRMHGFNIIQLFVHIFAYLYDQNRSALRNSERRSYDVTAISWQRMPNGIWAI